MYSRSAGMRPGSAEVGPIIRGQLLALAALLFAAIGLLIQMPVVATLWCMGAYALLLVVTVRTVGLPDYRSLLLIAAGLYAYIGPIDLVLMDSNPNFEPIYVAQSAFWSTVFLLAFSVTTSSFRNTDSRDTTEPPRVELYFLMPAVAGAFLGYLFFTYQDLATFGAASRADLISGASLLHELFALAALTGLVVQTALLRREISTIFFGGYWLGPAFVRANEPIPTERRLAVVATLAMIVVALLVEMVLLGNRREILSFLAAVFLATQIRRLPVWLWILVAFLIVFGTLLPWLRETPISEWPDLIMNFSLYFGSVDLEDVEFSGYSMIAHHFFATDFVRDYPTYLDAFGTLVPRSIWPDRPEPMGEWFVATYFPEIYRIGGGLAFNAVVESIMNFGYAGPIIVGGGLGFLFRRLSAWHRDHRIGEAAVVLAFFFWMRFDGATFIKGGLTIFVMIYAWMLLAKALALQGNPETASSNA